MDQALLTNLRKTREKAEQLEALAVEALETERDEIRRLKKELEARTSKRNKLMLELIQFGFTKHRVSQHGGVVPSYINHLENKK